MLQHVFRHKVLPKDIVLNKGPQFVSYSGMRSATFGGMSELFLRIPPPINGQTEQLNQKLEKGLCYLASQKPSLWSKQLIWVEYADNSLPCSSSGLSPFECVYGYQASFVPGVGEDQSSDCNGLCPQVLTNLG